MQLISCNQQIYKSRYLKPFLSLICIVLSNGLELLQQIIVKGYNGLHEFIKGKVHFMHMRFGPFTCCLPMI